MKRITFAVLMVFGILVAGCASFPKDDIDIATDSDPNVNFSDYKTYAWIGAAAILNDPEGKWKQPGFDTDALVTALIDSELNKHGMTMSEPNPDTLVAYAIGADFEQMKLKEDDVTNVKVLQNIPQGALVVVLLDANTEEVTWAGVAVADVQQKGDEVMKKRLQYTITEMFKQFPKK
jgi:hypothetical protein